MSVIKMNIRVILDDDPDMCCLYPLKKSQGNTLPRLEFIGEPTDLFYLLLEEMGWT
jgi:hypothetical protein